jgi:hypothetical protein
VFDVLFRVFGCVEDRQKRSRSHARATKQARRGVMNTTITENVLGWPHVVSCLGSEPANACLVTGTMVHLYDGWYELGRCRTCAIRVGILTAWSDNSWMGGTVSNFGDKVFPSVSPSGL